MAPPYIKPATIWVYPPVNPEWVQTISREVNLHPVTAQILLSRGFASLQTIHDYLYAKLPNLLDPDLFPEMEQAVDRILKAIQSEEKILIYGDNDVDGMTATALLVEFLRQLHCNVFFFITNSHSQKKGIISDALQFALKNQCSLLITVDCGITAEKQIQEVVEHHIDVIVTDHHEPTAKIPHCVATLNPKLLNSPYPNREITGVGVAFKLAHALTNALIENETVTDKFIDLKKYLDLVALGTISDMGSLLGENRIFVRYGLKQLRKTRRIGLLELFSICELNPAKLSPIDIASKIAPRLNSLGRIADPRKGVELLLIREKEEAIQLVQELDLHNIERQKIERRDTENIEEQIRKHPKILQAKAIVLCSTQWHPGIIPIITARITKQYNRPTMLIAIENGIGKGSIRTIREFPLLSVLKKNEHLLINFGGHDFAAGLTVKEENIPELQRAFIAAAEEQLKDADLISKLHLDAEIAFPALTFDFMESLSLLEPFGTDNPSPILYADVVQSWPPKVVGTTHLKFFLEQGDRMLEGIGFGMAERKKDLMKKNLHLRIAFTPQVNSFLNKSSIQLLIRDFQVIEPNPSND